MHFWPTVVCSAVQKNIAEPFCSSRIVYKYCFEPKALVKYVDFMSGTYYCAYHFLYIVDLLLSLHHKGVAGKIL